MRLTCLFQPSLPVNPRRILAASIFLIGLTPAIAPSREHSSFHFIVGGADGFSLVGLQRIWNSPIPLIPRRTTLKLHACLLNLALCCAVGLPAAAVAQTPMSSTATSHTNPAQVYGKLLSGFEKEITGAAEAMPADKYSFAPTQGEFKGVRSFGEQVKHLAEANYEFFDGWNVGTPVADPVIEKLTTKAEILKALSDSYAYAHKAIDSITAANAFDAMGKEGDTRAGTAAFCLAHSMDHYGQMVVYLRMNGIVPPASRKSGM
jgi:uncharacterized damage-inducible protein DinB